MNRVNHQALVLSALLALTACGGGGGGGASNEPTSGSMAAPGGPSEATPLPAPVVEPNLIPLGLEGVFVGTLVGATSRDFQVVVLENREFYALYGTNIGSAFNVQGFVQGTGTLGYLQGTTTLSRGTFSSSNVLDFGVNPPASSTLTSTHTRSAEARSISGSIVTAGQTVTFAGNGVANARYSYDRSPSHTAEVEGTWNMTALGGAATTVNVAADGGFTGNSAGCIFTGRLTARPSGKNVFNVALTFGAAPCASPGQTGSGIGLFSRTDTNRQQLIMVGINSDRTQGTALFGVRF